MNDTRNLFEQARPTPLHRQSSHDDRAGDTKNWFQKVNEARTKVLRAQAEDKEKSARPFRKVGDGGWVGGERRPSVGLTALDDLTFDAKAASDADRAARRGATPVQPQFTEATVKAVIDSWLNRHAEFYPSPFNVENLRRALSWAMDYGCFFGIELLETIYAKLLRENYLEFRPEPRKRGFFVSTPAPREVAVFVSRAEREAAEQAQLPRNVNGLILPPLSSMEEEANAAAARNANFSELQRFITAGFKQAKPTMAPTLAEVL